MLSLYDSSKDIGVSQASVPGDLNSNGAIAPSPASMIESSGLEDSQIALAPDEIETLTSLVGRYDQLLAEVDALNLQIEALLKAESPPPAAT